MDDILDLFEFENILVRNFFEHYLETRDELKSLKAINLTFKDLQNWKNGETNYNEIKEALDEYFVSEIELSLEKEALSGNFKSAEFILRNRSSKYSKDKTEKSVSISSIVTDLMEKEDEENNG